MMKLYDITEKPLKIYGLAVADSEKRQFFKLSEEALERFPQYGYLGRRAAGGRVRFQTDAKKLYVKMTLAGTKEDINIPLSGSAGADIYLGKGTEAAYLGYIAPKIHTEGEITVEKTFDLTGEEVLVTINLPRNDHLLGMQIGIEERAKLWETPAYTVEKPIVFYGSSITEGGCAPRPGNAYTSIVSRWLDADYRNMGFSGSARGEEDFAEYLAGFPEMSLFVMDYDHNSPSPEHLAETHAPFFEIIRKAHPDVPVLFLSRPDTDAEPEDSIRRRDVVCATYEAAKRRGDEKVWFVDGHELFGKIGRSECTVDGCHPNTLGFLRMAERIYPVMQEMLKNV